jgi:peptide/nickel transport system ATP-binding protein
LLGESGAGKTTLARSLIRLLPVGCRTLSGSIRLRQTDIVQATERQMQALRGKQISWISQEPELTLSPVMSVGDQIGEVLRAHSRSRRSTRKQQVISMLADVGLTDARIYKAYPHELSGGQRQRVVIAQALILKPLLLIADEPTSALDNVTQASVIELLKKLRKEFEVSILFITHNAAVLHGFVDRVIVMRAGRIVEAGSSRHSYQGPEHPYIRVPGEAIPTMPPTFDAERTQVVARAPLTSPCADMPATDNPTRPVLEAVRISKVYIGSRGHSRESRIVAIQDLSLTLQAASTLALVGKSGSGKSTLARCLAGLETCDVGEIRIDGRNILSLRGNELKRIRRGIQLIFQHSATALNSRLTALEIVAEPLRIQAIPAKQRRERAMSVMKKLRIPEEWANRGPLTLSGGQRQRLALARALILNPKVLVLDEALSGLDLPAQMQIASLLSELQHEFSLAYLFISHDLPTAAFLASNIAVMDQGRIVEAGTAAEICADPQCTPTRDLVAASALTPRFVPSRVPSAI